jgi:site-specific recombinase XerD
MATSTSLRRQPNALLKGHPLLTSYEIHLRGQQLSDATVAHYIGASRQFLEFCSDQNLPSIEHISREHIELWLVSLREAGYRPHSVRNRFIGLRAWIRWLFAEDEIEKDPTARIKPPRAFQVDKDVATEDDLHRVLDMLGKKGRDRKAAPSERQRAERDALIIACLYDCGLRAGELADLKTENLNLLTGIIYVEKAKNHQPRTVRLSPAGLTFADRYLRHLGHRPEYLLAGKRGKMTRSGIWQIVTERFAQAGVKAKVGPHDLRHTSASHVAVAGGMSESEAMALYGWTDPEMWRHYTRQAREQAALAAHGRASPLQRLIGGRK